MAIGELQRMLQGSLVPTLASGIADAFHSLHLLLGWLSVFVIGGLSAYAFITRNRSLHAVPFVLSLPFALLLVPWSAPFTNLDDVYRDLCMLAYASYTVIAFAAFGLVFCADNESPDET